MLRIMTYNICLGGVDDDTTNRLPLIHEVVCEGRPNVLAVQEANEFDLRQYRRLFAFERATGLRGLLHPVHNGALFVRPDLQPIALWTGDPAGNVRMALRLRGPGGQLSAAGPGPGRRGHAPRPYCL